MRSRAVRRSIAIMRHRAVKRRRTEMSRRTEMRSRVWKKFSFGLGFVRVSVRFEMIAFLDKLQLG